MQFAKEFAKQRSLLLPREKHRVHSVECKIREIEARPPPQVSLRRAALSTSCHDSAREGLFQKARAGGERLQGARRGYLLTQLFICSQGIN